MQSSDRRKFAEALTHLFALYEMEVTDAVLSGWWGVLAPYKLSAVLAAMSIHAGDIRQAPGGQPAGHFKPTPADIRLHLETTLPAMLDERRGKIVAEARARITPLRERIATIENDMRLGMPCEGAKTVLAHCGNQIAEILAEQDVQMAMAPAASLRDQEAEIGPPDRLPAAVRKALGWMGHIRRG